MGQLIRARIVRHKSTAKCAETGEVKSTGQVLMVTDEAFHRLNGSRPGDSLRPSAGVWFERVEGDAKDATAEELARVDGEPEKAMQAASETERAKETTIAEPKGKRR
jgi:hypothetical protein